MAEVQATPRPYRPGQTETSEPKATDSLPVLSPDKTGLEPSIPILPTTTPNLSLTAAAAANVSIGGQCSYTVDKTALIQQPSVLDFNQEGPTVLIIHTHASEAYTQEAGWEYTENGVTKTQNENYSVIRVGTELAEVLTDHGVNVIHDTEFHDYPSFNGSYTRTLQKIESYLQQYPTIQMVIDVHRDAASDAEGNPISRTTVINGESTAQVMLVVGTDEGG